MARRILERWWKLAVERGDENAKYYVVEFLAQADPVGALQKISTIKFPTEQSRCLLQSLIARRLAKTDFDERETVAESIADPGIRASTLARLADLLPEKGKQRKQAILACAAVSGPGSSRAVGPCASVRRGGGAVARTRRDRPGQGTLRRGLSECKRGERRLVNAQRSRGCWHGLICPERSSSPNTLPANGRTKR